MTQHFYPDRRPIGGPSQVLSAANFSTGWYNEYPSLAEPFAYPDDGMLTIPTTADRSRIRYDRWGQAAIGLRAKGRSEVRSLELTAPELESLYARHRVRIQEMGKDVDQRCETDDVEIVT